MNILGIIAEYNPFHNGHLYHLEQCVQQAGADAAVAVMSGNFTQRGEPAMMDKWTRSRLAVQCGVDLVLELPFAFAVNSAEYFAKGGIGILSGLGCVTHLGFGGEQGTLGELETMAELLAKEPPQYQQVLKEFLEKGASYPKAREKAMELMLGKRAASLSLSPNNILAIEYLKQLKILDSSIIPIMVNRKGPGYFDEQPVGNIASATAIRDQMDKQQRVDYVPPPVKEALTEVSDTSSYFQLIQSAVLRCGESELARICSVGEGLEHKLKKQIRTCGSLKELVEAVSSKRYPKARIRRILCQLLMGLTEFEPVFYARVLAAGEKGTRLLRQAKKKSSIPIITNINKAAALPQLMTYDILAGDIYNLLAGYDLYQRCDHVMGPYIEMGKSGQIP